MSRSFHEMFPSVQFSHSVVSDSLRPQESQHARPPCPSPTHRVYSDSCPSSQWCHPAISSFVIPFSSCPQSLPASESFPMSQLFARVDQSTGVLVLLNFLKKSLVFPILLFSSFLFIDHWGRLSYLSCCFWNSAFRWVYLSISPLPFASLLFSAVCKASSDNHFAFLHFFFLGMGLITAFCTMSQTSIHSS